VAGNVVTVKEGAGEGVATIEATFVIDGVTFTKDFTVTLVGAGLTGQVYYSTDDNQFFFTNSELASKEVTKVTDFETNTVYFENGTATADIENTTNAIDSYIRWVNVTCADGTEGKIQLISYTKVINEASDLTALINTKGTASAQETVTGYFALLGDIIVDSSYDTVDNAYSFFAGVLDGNGHTIKNLVVGANGLIGGITAGGQIKNLAITVTSASAGATGLIANKSKFTANASNAYDGSNASSVFLIDNCYFDIDFAWNGASSSLFGLAVAQAQSLNIINSVIDVATGVFTAPTTANAAVGYGVIYNNPAVGQMTSQIGDYVYFGKQNTTTKYVLFDNTYYVNNDYAFISVKLGTNANTKLAFVCENDTAAVSANASTYRVALVSGLNRYSSVSELPSTATAIRPSANA
ncbi:MAG: hypothetical protein J6R83_03435, partial [Clostridia bacterium]|nr:hypothetical protein [Clostridia bacterium]